MDTPTKTRVDAAKTDSKRQFKKNAESTGDFKIADKTASASKTKSKENEDEKNKEQEIYIPLEKRQQIIEYQKYLNLLDTKSDDVSIFIIK